MASSLAAALRATARAGSAARGLERRASCRAASSSGRSARSASTEPPTVPAPAPPLRLYYSDWAKVNLPDKHRFPMDKYRATRLLLEADLSLRGRVEMVRSPEASLEDVLRVHDREYVSRVMRCALTEKEARAIGFPMQNPEQVTRSFASTGGTIAATRDVLRSLDGDEPHANKVAAQIAGGTHHAFADSGEGFCVFNDIACAANVALAERGDVLFARSATPILVIDLDVHQGNGTAKIFETNDAVVTFSMHGAGNYPWKTKMRSDHDVDLPDDTDDDAYLSTLQTWLPFLFDTYRPALVFYQAGVDALREDSFGRLAMSRNGLLKRNNLVYDFCARNDAALVVTMGGGYSRPFDASVAAHADVFRSAAYRFGGGNAGSLKGVRVKER
jgi:acetoin utilization deacetylase AcuC-like enzyme